jgi:O-antigen ligase
LPPAQFPVVAFGIFLLFVFFQGGIARLDLVAQLVPRLAAVVLLAYVTVSHTTFRFASVRGPLVLLGCAVALILVQLIPLPATLWKALPGHDVYASGAVAADMTTLWRPWTLTPDRTWNALVALIVPAAVVVTMGCLDDDQRARIVVLLVAMVIGSAILGLLQLSSGDLSGFQIYTDVTAFSAGGAFANRNHQALFLAMGLPMLAHLAISQRRQASIGSLQRWLYGAAAMFVIVTIPTTGSRAGLIVAGVGIAGAVALLWTSATRAIARLPRRTRLAVIAGLATIMVVIALTTVLGARSEAFSRLFSQAATDDRRFQTLAPILHMTEAFFPFGAGFGSFDPVFRHFEPDTMLSTFYVNEAHNEYLQVVAEGGIFGAMLMGAAILWFAMRTVQVWRAPSSSRIRLARMATFLIGMTLIAIVVDYPTRTPMIMTIVAIAAVWIESGIQPDADNWRQTRPLPATASPL